jgi:hypothetical protein
MPALPNRWVYLPGVAGGHAWQMAPLWEVRKKLASFFGNKACDLVGKAIRVISIAAEIAQVLVAGELRNSAHIAIGPLEGRGDREMTQPLRSDRETGFVAELADDVVDRSAGQTMALAGPVEIDEQRTGFGAARFEPGGNSSPGWLGQGHQLPS